MTPNVPKSLKNFATVTTLFILTLVLTPTQSPAQVAFISDRGGEMDIYTFDTDTSAIRKVTAPGEVEYGVTWSKDGKYLYFIRYKEGDQNIWRITPDGEGLERITEGTHQRNINDISPDGKRILLNSKRENPQGDTYAMDIDGKNVKRITDNAFFEAGAVFAPDGKSVVVSVAITSSKGPESPGNAELFRFDLDGKELKRLTKTDSTFDALPAFSPDGKRLAYHGCKTGECAIIVMDLASGSSVNVTNGDPDSRWPRWSPDGKWIAYTRSEKGNTDVWIVRPDGSGRRAFIVGPGRDEIAAFGPRSVKMP